MDKQLNEILLKLNILDDINVQLNQNHHDLQSLKQTCENNKQEISILEEVVKNQQKQKNFMEKFLKKEI